MDEYDYYVKSNKQIDINDLLADIDDPNIIKIILKEHRANHCVSFYPMSDFFKSIVEQSLELREYFIAKRYIGEVEYICPICDIKHFIEEAGQDDGGALYDFASLSGFLDECPYSSLQLCDKQNIDYLWEGYKKLCLNNQKSP